MWPLGSHIESVCRYQALTGRNERRLERRWGWECPQEGEMACLFQCLTESLSRETGGRTGPYKQAATVLGGAWRPEWEGKSPESQPIVAAGDPKQRGFLGVCSCRRAWREEERWQHSRVWWSLPGLEGRREGKASKAGLGMELEKWLSIFLKTVLASSSSGESSCRPELRAESQGCRAWPSSASSVFDTVLC